MINRIDNRRLRTALVGIVLAGSAVVGATSVVDAASDTATDDSTPVGLVDDGDADIDPADRHARHEARHEARQEHRAEIATLLGLDADALGEQLRSGSTLADVATAQGVEVSAVVDLIVEQKTERLDAAVEAGLLTQAEADEKAVELAERVQTRVEEGRPQRADDREGRGGRIGRGHHGPRGEDVAAGDDIPAEAEG